MSNPIAGPSNRNDGSPVFPIPDPTPSLSFVSTPSETSSMEWLANRISFPFNAPAPSIADRKYFLDNRPSDYEYALMSKHVYQGNNLNHGNFLPQFENWKIHSTQEAPIDYFSAIYVNDETQQIVLAYRGTKSLEALLLEGIKGIVLNQLSPQKERAFDAVKLAVSLLKEKTQPEKPYHLSFTGHSLGAFLAELSVFYAHADFQLMDVHAVTFESPGSKVSLKKMQPKQKRVDLDTLDIIGYVSYPNAINTLNKHVGTLYQMSPDLNKIETNLIDLVTGKKYTKKSHAMQGILNTFKEAHRYQNIPSSLYMTDWPLLNREKDNCFNYLEKKEGRYVLKEAYKTDPNFSLSYRCGYRYDRDLSNLTSLPLRHFSSDIQKFLKDFDRERRKSTPQKVEEICKTLNVSEELTEHLIGYRNENGVITIKEGNVRDFRTNLSQWLVDNPDKIAALLNPPLSPIKRLTKLWNVSSKNPYFIQRACLNDIEESLKKSRIVVCHGLGGMGKTQLALEFVWKNHEKYRGTAWFNSESANKLLIEYDRLGQDLNLPRDEKMNMQEKGHQVKRWLEDPSHTGWLLVYDNVQAYGGPDGISSWIPSTSANSRVLITSRLSEVSYTSIPIEKFSRNESIKCIEKILEKPLSEEDKQSVNALAYRLGDFPLGLAQAASYIKKNKMKVTRYLELYKTKKKHLLQDKTYAKSASVLKDDHERAVVYVTWDITFEAIHKESPLAENWLRVCSYLANEIPDFLFKTFAENDSNNLNEEIYEEARGILNSYSMLIYNKENESASIHSLLQDVIRMKEKDEGPEVEKKRILITVQLLQECFPEGEQLEDYAKMRQLLPHFEVLLPMLEGISDKSLEAELWFLVHLLKQAQIYGDLGYPHKQKELLERAFRIQESYFGKDHTQVAITLGNLGTAYGALGDPQKKKELLKRALRIKENYFGKDHFEVAITLGNLGNAYGDLGEHKKKKELLERALSILENQYGKDHFQVARTLGNLGTAYGALGDPHKAKELLERALLIEEKHYGKDHIQVARTLGNLGNAYFALGDPYKQKELLELAFPIFEKHYGKGHFEVASRLVNLGNAYGDLGDHQKKKELLKRALRIKENYFGKDHFEVAKALQNLGNAYGALGDPHKAKELLERALLIEEKHYGKDHFQVARTLVNLGNAYGDLGDPQKQKELLERAFPILEKHYGKDHSFVAQVRSMLRENARERTRE